LARFSENLHIGLYLLMGHGEEESGGRERPAILCAAFEAVIGAIYLDKGLDAVKHLVEPLLEAEIPVILREGLDRDPKSELQELAQGMLHRTPRYVTVAEHGPDHAKEFTVEVVIAGKTYGRGVGSSKQQGAQAAAQEALARLDRDQDSEDWDLP
jgi:ribonuclease-3